MTPVPHQNRLQDLANKWLRGDISSIEQQEFNNWFQEGVEFPAEIPESFAASEEEHKEKLWKAIQQKRRQVKVVKIWPRIAAAIAVVMFGAWLYTMFYHGPVHDPETIGYARQIGPGKHTAVLMINGSSVQLSDTKTGVAIHANELTYNDGSSVGVGLKDEMTLSTPRGGTYLLVLSDGTRAWLNADSRISFPKRFSGNKRKILLAGEAYFEVAKDKMHPFVVQTKNQEIQVLGTHFNVNSYTDEESERTTLLEGSVQVSSLKGDYKVVLEPGQQAALTPGSPFRVKDTDAESAIDWKNGDFIFKGENLESAMRKVARWYNVEIVYSQNANKDVSLVGSVSRSRSFLAVLELLERTGSVKLKAEGRKITVL